MFPRNENRNEGTFACSPRTKNGTRVHSPKPPFYETALSSASFWKAQRVEKNILKISVSELCACRMFCDRGLVSLSIRGKLLKGNNHRGQNRFITLSYFSHIPPPRNFRTFSEFSPRLFLEVKGLQFKRVEEIEVWRTPQLVGSFQSKFSLFQRFIAENTQNLKPRFGWL